MLINEEEPGQTVNNQSRLSGSIDEDICVWKRHCSIGWISINYFSSSSNSSHLAHHSTKKLFSILLVLAVIYDFIQWIQETYFDLFVFFPVNFIYFLSFVWDNAIFHLLMSILLVLKSNVWIMDWIVVLFSMIRFIQGGIDHSSSFKLRA